MKTKLLDLLIRLRVFDPDGSLSLTSLAFLVVTTKVAMLSEMSAVDLGAFLTVALTYQGKKYINRSKGGDTEVVAALGQTVKGLADRVQVLDNRTAPGNRR